MGKLKRLKLEHYLKHNYKNLLKRQDGASPIRIDLAKGKAHGAVMMGISSRKLGERAEQQAYFIQAVNALCDGSLVPVAGGLWN